MEKVDYSAWRIRERNEQGQLVHSGFQHPVGRYWPNTVIGFTCGAALFLAGLLLFMAGLSALVRDFNAYAGPAFQWGAGLGLFGLALRYTPASWLSFHRAVAFSADGTTFETPRRQGLNDPLKWVDSGLDHDSIVNIEVQGFPMGNVYGGTLKHGWVVMTAQVVALCDDGQKVVLWYGVSVNEAKIIVAQLSQALMDLRDEAGHGVTID